MRPKHTNGSCRLLERSLQYVRSNNRILRCLQGQYDGAVSLRHKNALLAAFHVSKTKRKVPSYSHSCEMKRVNRFSPAMGWHLTSNAGGSTDLCRFWSVAIHLFRLLRVLRKSLLFSFMAPSLLFLAHRCLSITKIKIKT